MLSGKTLTGCSKDKNGKIIEPLYVCFPVPYGTASPTSDYDVGLIGPTAGSLTIEFNKYFNNKFNGIPSEDVFDTNVYGYSLEYAMPQAFSGLTGFYMTVLPKFDFDPQFQMLELAGAYRKVGEKFSFRFYVRLILLFVQKRFLANQANMHIIIYYMDKHILLATKTLVKSIHTPLHPGLEWRIFRISRSRVVFR